MRSKILSRIKELIPGINTWFFIDEYQKRTSPDKFPLITYQLITTTPWGRSERIDSYQISIWSKDIKEIDEIIKKLISWFNYTKTLDWNSCKILSISKDLYDNESKVSWRALTLQFNVRDISF